MVLQQQEHVLSNLLGVSEVCRFRGVRVFKLNCFLPRTVLSPGFGLFTIYLQTRSFVSFSEENPQKLNGITTPPIPYTFTFDLKKLSSRQSFFELLTDEFLQRTPLFNPDTARHMAFEVAKYVATNFVYWDEKSSPTRVIVADFFYQITTCLHKEIGEKKPDFTAKGILRDLGVYLEIPSLSSNRYSDKFLIEIPALERFHDFSLDKCVICLDEFYTNGEKMVKKTNCSHMFHGDCLARWLWEKPSCPVCRLPL